MPVVIGLALQDVGLAIAVVLGGLTGVLPQAWFAWYAFRGKGRQGRVTERLIQGEATKIGLAALMCAAAFRCIPELQAVPFFVALITMMALGWWITARVLTAKV
jgi:F0F1-type ATP synthase assembly protein I